MERAPGHKESEIDLYDSLFHSALNSQLEKRDWSVENAKAESTRFEFILNANIPSQILEEFVAELKANLPDYDWTEAISTEDSELGYRFMVDYAQVKKRS